MKTEPMTSPAIVQAVYDYQKQRELLVRELVSKSGGYIEHITERTKPLTEAIAIIDAKIERLCLRLTS
jgi:hypothetical protein